MTISWVPPIVRKRYVEVDPHKDERRVRAELRPRTGQVQTYGDLPLARRVLVGAVGLGGYARRGEE